MTLEKALKELLIKDPFYGIFMLNLDKQIVSGDHRVKTAAVGLTGLTYTLYINEDFWNKWTDNQQIGLLKHEICHLMFFHLTDTFECDDHQLMNIAQDCEINQLLTDLPEGGVTLESVSKACNKPLEPRKGSWYYYKALMEVKDKSQTEQLSTIDDHSLWPQDLSDAEQELLKGQLKAKIKEAAEQVQKMCGSIPGEFAGLLEKIKNKPAIFNWKKFMRKMIGNTITSEITLTRMRPNKRFPDARGFKMKRKPNIMVAVDTSGSVSDRELQEFFSEIHHIWKTGVDVTVVECDTTIGEVFKYNGKQEIKISGRGGTELHPAIEYYKQHKEFSSCVMFTDGYCNTTMPSCHNLIWVITSDGNKSGEYYPGKTIFIPKEN